MLGAKLRCGIKSGFDGWAKVSRSAAHLVDTSMYIGCSSRPASAAFVATCDGGDSTAAHATHARDFAAAADRSRGSRVLPQRREKRAHQRRGGESVLNGTDAGAAMAL